MTAILLKAVALVAIAGFFINLQTATNTYMEATLLEGVAAEGRRNILQKDLSKMVENYPKIWKFIRYTLRLASLACRPTTPTAFIASSFLSTLVVVAAAPQPKLLIAPVRRHQRRWHCRLLLCFVFVFWFQSS